MRQRRIFEQSRKVVLCVTVKGCLFAENIPSPRSIHHFALFAWKYKLHIQFQFHLEINKVIFLDSFTRQPLEKVVCSSSDDDNNNKNDFHDDMNKIITSLLATYKTMTRKKCVGDDKIVCIADSSRIHLTLAVDIHRCCSVQNKHSLVDIYISIFSRCLWSLISNFTKSLPFQYAELLLKMKLMAKSPEWGMLPLKNEERNDLANGKNDGSKNNKNYSRQTPALRTCWDVKFESQDRISGQAS